eukprot:TRINITY_DN6493_c0_g1_i1.p1 TRINITY_DN6493_c0_g1~~TRINITY_DN6493_c0_g1_i1.p1  ORF type:complete len:517 (-),score=42.18 TRINITY_DN6493_c0_g1_i1:142-1584(-)
MDLEIIPSNKGGMKLCYQGFMYTKHTVGKRIRWRCVNRTSRCGGTLTTNSELVDPQNGVGHNHESDPDLVKAKKALMQMKEKASITDENPSTIYEESIQNINSISWSKLGHQESIKRTLRNMRARNSPPVPVSLLECALKDEWGGSKSADDPFLFYDNVQQTTDRLILMGSNRALERLCKAEVWMMERNSSMAPTKFVQLIVIRLPLDDSSIPAVYALFQSKTQGIYEEFFNAIRNRCQELDLIPDPATILIDFEVPVIEAIKYSLGYEVQTQGCFPYLTQIMWKMIQALGLSMAYKDNEIVRDFCGELIALAFLPLEDVISGIIFLYVRCPPEAIPLLEYFNTTYVCGTHRPARTGDLVGFKEIPPRFPPEFWNVHLATLSDDPSTKYQVEGCNDAFFHLNGQHFCSIQKCVSNMKKEEAAVRRILAERDIGPDPLKRPKRENMDLKECCKGLCYEYLSGEQTLSQFLSTVSQYIEISS